jgi:hypothetical protein
VDTLGAASTTGDEFPDLPRASVPSLPGVSCPVAPAASTGA